jgi:hypothetical protein
MQYVLRPPSELVHGIRTGSLQEEVAEIVSVDSKATLEAGRRRVSALPCRLCGLPRYRSYQGSATQCCAGHLECVHTVYAPLVREVIELLNAVCSNCGDIFISDTMDSLCELSERMELMQCLDTFKSKLVGTSTTRARNVVDQMKENRSTHGTKSRRCKSCNADAKVTFSFSNTGELYMNTVSGVGGSGVRLGLMGIRSRVARINALMQPHVRHMLGLHVDIHKHLVATVSGGFSGLFVGKDVGGGSKSLNNLTRFGIKSPLTSKQNIQALTDCMSRSQYTGGLSLPTTAYVNQAVERMTDVARETSIGGTTAKVQQTPTQRRNRIMQSGGVDARSTASVTHSSGEGDGDGSGDGGDAPNIGSTSNSGSNGPVEVKHGSAIQTMTTKSRRADSMRLLHSNAPQLTPDLEDGAVDIEADMRLAYIPQRFLRGDTSRTGLPAQVGGLATLKEALGFVHKRVLLQLFDSRGRQVTPPPAWMHSSRRIVYRPTVLLDDLVCWVKTVYSGAQTERLQVFRCVMDNDILMVMRTPVIDAPPLVRVRILPDGDDPEESKNGMMCGSIGQWEQQEQQSRLNMSGKPDNILVYLEIPDAIQDKIGGDNDGDASNDHFIPFHLVAQMLEYMTQTRLDLMDPFRCAPILGWDVPEFLSLCSGAALGDGCFERLHVLIKQAATLFPQTQDEKNRTGVYCPLTQQLVSTAVVYREGYTLGSLKKIGTRVYSPRVEPDPDSPGTVWQMPLAVLYVPRTSIADAKDAFGGWLEGYTPPTYDNRRATACPLFRYTGDDAWSAEFGKLPSHGPSGDETVPVLVYTMPDREHNVVTVLYCVMGAFTGINFRLADVGLSGGLPVLAHGRYLPSNTPSLMEMKVNVSLDEKARMGCKGRDPMCARRTHTRMVQSPLMQGLQDCGHPELALKQMIRHYPGNAELYLNRCDGHCRDLRATWFSEGMMSMYAFIWENITRDIIYTGGCGDTVLEGSSSLDDLLCIDMYPERAILKRGPHQTTADVAKQLLAGGLPPMGIVCFPISTNDELDLLFQVIAARLTTEDTIRMFYLIARMGEAAGTNEHYHTLPSRCLEEDISGDGGCERVRELAVRALPNYSYLLNRDLQLCVLTHVTPSLWASRKVFTNVIHGVASKDASAMTRTPFGTCGHTLKTMQASRRPETDDELRKVGHAAQAIVPISESSFFNLWCIVRPTRMELANGQVPLVDPSARFTQGRDQMIIPRLPGCIPTWNIQLRFTPAAEALEWPQHGTFNEQMRYIDPALVSVTDEEFPQSHQFRGCYCARPCVPIVSTIVAVPQGSLLQSTRKDWLLDVVFTAQFAAVLLGPDWETLTEVYLETKKKKVLHADMAQLAVELYVTMTYARFLRGLPLDMDTAMDTLLGLDMIRCASAFVPQADLLLLIQEMAYSEDENMYMHMWPQLDEPYRVYSARPVFRSFMYNYAQWRTPTVNVEEEKSEHAPIEDIHTHNARLFGGVYRRGIAAHVAVAMGEAAEHKWHVDHHGPSDLKSDSECHTMLPTDRPKSAVGLVTASMPHPRLLVQTLSSGVLACLHKQAQFSCDAHINRCDAAPLCVIPDALLVDDKHNTAAILVQMYMDHETEVSKIRNSTCVAGTASKIQPESWTIDSYCETHGHREEKFAENLCKIYQDKLGVVIVADQMHALVGLCVPIEKADPSGPAVPVVVIDPRPPAAEVVDPEQTLRNVWVGLPAELTHALTERSVFGWNPSSPVSNHNALVSRVLPWYYQLKHGLTETNDQDEVLQQVHTMSWVIRAIHSATLQAQLDAKKNPLDATRSRADMKVFLTRPLIIPSERNCFDLYDRGQSSDKLVQEYKYLKVVYDEMGTDQRDRSQFISLATSATLTCIPLERGHLDTAAIAILDFPFRTLGLYLHQRHSKRTTANVLSFEVDDQNIPPPSSLPDHKSVEEVVDDSATADHTDDAKVEDVAVSDNHAEELDPDELDINESDEDENSGEDRSPDSDNDSEDSIEHSIEHSIEDDDKDPVGDEDPVLGEVDHDTEVDYDDEDARALIERDNVVQKEDDRENNATAATKKGRKPAKGQKQRVYGWSLAKGNLIQDHKGSTVAHYDILKRVSTQEDAKTYAMVKPHRYLVKGVCNSDLHYTTSRFQPLIEGTSKSVNSPHGVRVDGSQVIQRMKQSSNTTVRFDIIIRQNMLYVLVQTQKQRADLKMMTLGNPMRWPVASCGLLQTRGASTADVYDVNPIARLVVGLPSTCHITPRHDLEFMRMYGVSGQVDSMTRHLVQTAHVHRIPSMLYSLFATAHCSPCTRQDDTHSLVSVSSGAKSRLYRSLVTRGYVKLPDWVGDADDTV